MKIFSISILLLAFIFFGCDSKKDDENTLQKVNMTSLNVPTDFDYGTTKEVEVHITLLTNTNAPISGIGFSVYNRHPIDNGKMLANSVTNEQGEIHLTIVVPSYQDSLSISGFMMTETVAIIDNTAILNYGGNGKSEATSALQNTNRHRFFTYHTEYDANGRPLGLEQDDISSEFLARIDASLPERISVPELHPDYLAEGTQTNISLNETCEVWVTFVHEGAGYKNSLGFYTYNQEDGPPANPNELVHHIIIPNASLIHSGGTMLPGDKIYLGEFSADTVIGWFIVANGWTGTETSPTRVRYYSNPAYNPETNPLYQQHNVLLYDDVEEKFLIGFEDLQRPSGDNDFNDLLFYVTANPPEAVDTANVSPMDTPYDSDNDGVSDVYDQYPDDPDRAFNYYYPSAGNYGTLAFEDLWPQQGDYDMNDMVVQYQFISIHNAIDDMVALRGIIKLVAVGGSNQNGFSIEFPWSVSDIAGIESFKHLENPVPYEMELIDADDLSVLRVIKNTNDLIQTPGQGVYVNTQVGETFFEPVTVHFEMEFASFLHSKMMVIAPPYNPFIIINQDETKEVHLPHMPPTSLADPVYFQTFDDDTQPDMWRFYVTENNLPWAIHIPENWNYPRENSQITWGYLAFKPWAESDGFIYEDWFQMIAGRIDEEYLYLFHRKK
jgi:LruC domain-containing protein